MPQRVIWARALIVAGVVVAGAGVALLVTSGGKPVVPRGENDRAESRATSPAAETAKVVSPTPAGAEPREKPANGGSGGDASQTAPKPAGHPSPSPKSPGRMSPAALEAAMDQLGRLKFGVETDEAVAALVPQGDAAVTEIRNRLAERDPDLGWRHTAVRILKGVNSEESRAILRGMALGEWSGRNPPKDVWAAQALMACDPAEAWVLLTSPAPEVLVPALSAVKGQPVDAKRLALLKSCLPHRMNVGVAWRAALVMAHGSTGNVAREAVDAIGEALSAVAADPKANTPYPRAGGSTFFEAYGGSYIEGLLIARVDHQVLHDLAGRLQGRARDAVLVALARRGDASVHDAMVKLAQDPEGAMFRAWASRGFGEIGRPEDLPLLRTLAKTDPLVREGLLPAPHPIGATGPTYPVREAAEDAIRTIEKKAKQPKK